MSNNQSHVQSRRVLAGSPVADVDDFVERNGGEGLQAARRRGVESIVSLLDQSGLRGRGGAGFPTGTKLRSVADALGDGARSHVIVNAAEGEPGTFKDRTILRHSPYQVIEGACIAAAAVGTSDVIIAIKASFTQEIERLRRAIDEMSSAGMIKGLTVRIVEGPSEYLFGEETALLEVIEGRPPFPRVVPPYRVGLGGDWTQPTGRWMVPPAVFVSNVETYANLPGILRHGAEWFRSIGTADSPGTIVCTVTGDTRRHGCGEFPLGVPLREVIDELGEGLVDDLEIAAVLSGVSNRPFGPDQLETPLTYADTVAAGSGLGSASFIVVDSRRDLRQVAAAVARFLAVESCGQCEPCKRDGLAISEALTTTGTTESVEDRLRTVARGARCALAGQQERVVGGLLAIAEHAGMAGPSGDSETVEFVIAPLVDIVAGQARLDLSHLRKRPDWSYAGEEPDSHTWPAERLIDHPVEVRSAHLAEADGPADRMAPLRPVGARDVFEELGRIEAVLEERLDTMRHAPSDEWPPALDGLRRELERHRHVTERFVYPLVSRLCEEDDGDDVAWYPQRHEQHAGRLLQRLDLESTSLSPALVDELCADVHASIIELQRRVLPLLRTHLSADEQEALLVEAGVQEAAAQTGPRQ